MESSERAKAPIQNYEDLEVFRRGMRLMKEIQAFSMALLRDERNRLGDQMRRAARSVPTNIAEGFAKRSSAKEFKRYLTISMASANEMEVHLKIARDLGFGAEPDCHRLIDEYQIEGKQLRRLIERWRKIEDSPPASTVQPPASARVEKK